MKTIYTFLFFFLFHISFIQAQGFGDFYVNVLAPNELLNYFERPEFGMPIDFGWDGTIKEDVTGNLVLTAKNENGLRSYCESSGEDFQGKFVMIDRGDCFFSIKALNAQNAGAIGVIIKNFEDDVIDMGTAIDAELVSIPFVMLGFSNAVQLEEKVLQGENVIIQFSQTQVPIAKIEGVLRVDENEDCISDFDEFGLAKWKVLVSGPNDYSKMVQSKSDGSFSFKMAAGAYKVEVIPINDIWKLCKSFEVNTVLNETITIDPLASMTNDCAMMSVEIEPFFLRRCFDDNHYVIDYCNVGNLIAEEAYIDVTFDELLIVDDASMPFEDLGANSFRFQLGDVEPYNCGKLNVFGTVSCDVSLGQSLCAQADIYPKEDCEIITYAGPSIRVNGHCGGSELAFTIENIGDGDMLAPKAYQVFQNDQLFTSGTYRLKAAESKGFSFESDGNTYRLEAEQVDEYPELTSPSKTIEACADGSDEITTGYLLQFARADYGLSFDESCERVIGSFDPNDKLPSPLGFGEEGLIEKNTDLAYKIRFQNTGTDTAFNIVIKDQLSEFLDVQSIEFGPSSHEYELSINDGNLMEFRFNDIMLLDSFENEAASHGFVTYTIKQNKDLALGTVITNKAEIYFDFNEAIVTNTTVHTIGENFLNPTSINRFNNNLELAVFPNPMQDFTLIDLNSVEIEKGVLQVFDSMGKLVDQRTFNGSRIQYDNRQLDAGFYVFNLFSNYQLLGSKKVEIIKSK